MDESSKRKKIQEIYNNTNLTNQEKQIEINKILNPNSKFFLREDNNTNTISEYDIDNLDVSSNCKHYQRNCMILSPCCNKWFHCRLCHNEDNDHEIDRYLISKILCKKCLKIQNASNKCINCGIEFAEYYCNICKLWKSLDTDSFHCEKCNLCWLGKKNEFIHCDNCNTCLKKTAFDSHTCIKDSIKNICPICNEKMFGNTYPVIPLKCGHYMHLDCFNEYSKNEYKCPLCKKSIYDKLDALWDQIDIEMENSQMPNEFKNWISHIICNDCEIKSFVSYHFLYHKCKTCNGYNTNIIDIIKN